MIQQNQKVKIQKIDQNENPEHDTATWDEYVEGEVNVKSPPVKYEAKGHLLEDISIGNSVKIHRFERNGEKIEGLMTTSRVEQIKGDSGDELVVYTQNSVYMIEKID